MNKIKKFFINLFSPKTRKVADVANDVIRIDGACDNNICTIHVENDSSAHAFACIRHGNCVLGYCLEVVHIDVGNNRIRSTTMVPLTPYMHGCIGTIKLDTVFSFFKKSVSDKARVAAVELLRAANVPWARDIEA